MSETHVSVGTITSPKPKCSRSTVIVSRLAEAPEFTNTQCFTPTHFAHSCSKARTFCDWVRIGSSCCKNSISASRSARVMLFFIKGQGPIVVDFLCDTLDLIANLSGRVHFSNSRRRTLRCSRSDGLQLRSRKTTR